MSETAEQEAMKAATRAVRDIIAQSKNPRTTLGRMTPTAVAFHAAWAAITAHQTALDERMVRLYRERKRHDLR